MRRSSLPSSRIEADLAQVKLADALGISLPQIAIYEVGKRRVTVSLLPRLARLLDMPVELLIGEDSSASASTAPALRQRGCPPSKLER